MRAIGVALGIHLLLDGFPYPDSPRLTPHSPTKKSKILTDVTHIIDKRHTLRRSLWHVLFP
jgi:hypothetical protein